MSARTALKKETRLVCGCETSCVSSRPLSIYTPLINLLRSPLSKSSPFSLYFHHSAQHTVPLTVLVQFAPRQLVSIPCTSVPSRCTVPQPALSPVLCICKKYFKVEGSMWRRPLKFDSVASSAQPASWVMTTLSSLLPQIRYPIIVCFPTFQIKLM